MLHIYSPKSHDSRPSVILQALRQITVKAKLLFRRRLILDDVSGGSFMLAENDREVMIILRDKNKNEKKSFESL